MTTDHAIDRTQNRLQNLVTPKMMHRAERIASFVGSGKYYIELAKFDTCIHLDCDGNINGDAIVAVVRNNNIVTVMLAKSWKTKTYFTDGKYVTL